MEKFNIVGHVFVDTLSDFILVENLYEMVLSFLGFSLTLVLFFLPAVFGGLLLNWLEKKHYSKKVLFAIVAALVTLVQISWAVHFAMNLSRSL